MKHFFLVILSLNFVFPLYLQEGADGSEVVVENPSGLITSETGDKSSENNPGNMDEEKEVWASENSEKSDSEIVSIVEERRATLKYGIDKSVLEVLSKIREEKTETYNQDIYQLLQETENPQIMIQIFSFFTEINDGLAEDKAVFLVNEVLEDQNVEEDVLIAAVNYLGERKKNDFRQELYALLKQKSQKVVRAALIAVGKLDPGEESFLVRELVFESDDEDLTDETRNQGILTLGELKDREAGEDLIEFLLDEENNLTTRQYSCIALGKINYEEAIDPLIEIYTNSDNSHLRSYAISGLTWFESEVVEDILKEAAKRDSFWQIRVNAIKGIRERKMSDCLDMLIYKSKSDPENNVKKEALKTIGSFDDEDSNIFLLEYFNDVKINQALRLNALDALIENNYAPTIDSLLELYDKNVEKDFGRFLEFCCLKLSTADWPELKPMYAKMLSHENYILQIYAVRGIKRNTINDLYESVRNLDNDKSPQALRKEIKGNF